jgi:hypothetical protein
MPLLRRSLPIALLVAVALTTATEGSGRAIAYVAPAGYCAGGWTPVMSCLYDYARHQAGLPPLNRSLRLSEAARAKSLDIARCGFSHTACGHRFDYRIDRTGYRWRSIGENIAWGSGSLGRPYTTFSAWMRSPGHRANILNPGFQDFGITVRRGAFSGHADAAVWVAEFARH